MFFFQLAKLTQKKQWETFIPLKIDVTRHIKTNWFHANDHGSHFLLFISYTNHSFNWETTQIQLNFRVNSSIPSMRSNKPREFLPFTPWLIASVEFRIPQCNGRCGPFKSRDEDTILPAIIVRRACNGRRRCWWRCRVLLQGYRFGLKWTIKLPVSSSAHSLHSYLKEPQSRKFVLRFFLLYER